VDSMMGFHSGSTVFLSYTIASSSASQPDYHTLLISVHLFISSLPAEYKDYIVNSDRHSLINSLGSLFNEAIHSQRLTITLQTLAAARNTLSLLSANATTNTLIYIPNDSTTTDPTDYPINTYASASKLTVTQITAVLLAVFVGALLVVIMVTVYFRHAEQRAKNEYVYSITRVESSNDLLLRSQSSESTVSSNGIRAGSNRIPFSAHKNNEEEEQGGILLSPTNNSQLSTMIPKGGLVGRNLQSREILNVKHNDVESGDIIVFYDEDNSSRSSSKF